MNDFPTHAVLVDTGERRYPEEWEFYFWKDSAGHVRGPFAAGEGTTRNVWLPTPPERFAIYKVQEIDENLQVSEGL